MWSGGLQRGFGGCGLWCGLLIVGIVPNAIGGRGASSRIILRIHGLAVRVNCDRSQRPQNTTLTFSAGGGSKGTGHQQEGSSAKFPACSSSPVAVDSDPQVRGGSSTCKYIKYIRLGFIVLKCQAPNSE